MNGSVLTNIKVEKMPCNLLVFVNSVIAIFCLDKNRFKNSSKHLQTIICDFCIFMSKFATWAWATKEWIEVMLSWPLTGEGHESPEAIAAIVGDGGVRRAISGVSLSIRFTRKLQAAGSQWTRRSKHTHTQFKERMLRAGLCSRYIRFWVFV